MKMEKKEAIKQLKGLIKLLGEMPSEKVIGFETIRIPPHTSQNYVELTRVDDEKVRYMVHFYDEKGKTSFGNIISTDDLPRKYFGKFDRAYKKAIRDDNRRQLESPVISSGNVASRMISVLKKEAGGGE